MKRPSSPRASPPRRVSIAWSMRMVDLVKIRKKAKEKKEGGAPAAPPAVPVAEEKKQDPAGDAAGAASGEATITDRLQKFLETAGTRREADGTGGGAATVQREVLTFVIDREHYGVDI